VKKETRNKIIREIVDFGKRILPTEYSIEELKRAFPFHAVFFTDEGLRAFKVQRSLVTKMGMKLYPKIALIIARERYNEAYVDYKIEGRADSGMIRKAQEIVSSLREGKRKPNAQLEWREILNAASGKTETHTVIADLYIGDHEEGPLFMEIKSPRPNLDVCAQSKLKMLIFKIIFKDMNPQAYLAFPYNPFIKRENYRHSPTERIMDLDNEVLIGEEMWDKIGGPGTFNELLEILDEAAKILRKLLK